MFLDRTEEGVSNWYQGNHCKSALKGVPPNGKQKKSRRLGTKRAVSFSKARSPFLLHQDSSTGCVCMNAIKIESDQKGVYDMDIEGRTSIRKRRGERGTVFDMPDSCIGTTRQAGRQAGRCMNPRTLSMCQKERLSRKRSDTKRNREREREMNDNRKKLE